LKYSKWLYGIFVIGVWGVLLISIIFPDHWRILGYGLSILLVLLLVLAAFYIISLIPIGRFLLWLDRILPPLVNPPLTAIEAFYAELGQEAVFVTPLPKPATVVIAKLGERALRERKAIVAVLPNYVAIYPLTVRMQEAFTFNTDDIRWFSLVRGYSDLEREIALDLEKDLQWVDLRIRMDKASIKKLTEAMEPIAPNTVLFTRSRRRPNVRPDPVQAWPATQDIHGAWTLDDPVKLCITPLYLVVLRDGYVQNSFLLPALENIRADKRLDNPDAAGLVRFTAADETFAYAVNDYAGFAEALAGAIKRNVEESAGQKQKTQADYSVEQADLDVDDDAIGDDGELHRR
jgi:hypothetical protein